MGWLRLREVSSTAQGEHVMKKSRLGAVVGLLAFANLGVWAVAQQPLAAIENDHVISAPDDQPYPRDCFYSVLIMGCGEWLFGGCEDVSDC